MTRRRRRRAAREFPPPYRQLIRWAGVEGFFLLAAGLAAAALLFSVLQENRELLGLVCPASGGGGFCSVHLLGTDVAATLLGAFLSLYFLRRQFLHAAMPLLDYRCRVGPASGVALSCDDETAARVWVVELSNVGQGAAIITGARYWLELEESGCAGPQRPDFMAWFEQRADRYGSRCRFRCDVHAVERRLAEAGLEDQRQFDLLHFGEWTALSPGESRAIFQLCLADAGAIIALDIELTYQSVVGDRYRREIYAIPRRQLPAPADDLSQRPDMPAQPAIPRQEEGSGQLGGPPEGAPPAQ